ncbi:MAG: hypothetical protein ACR2O2_01495 [Ruegeria sp.]
MQRIKTGPAAPLPVAANTRHPTGAASKIQNPRLWANLDPFQHVIQLGICDLPVLTQVTTEHALSWAAEYPRL